MYETPVSGIFLQKGYYYVQLMRGKSVIWYRPTVLINCKHALHKFELQTSARLFDDFS